MLFINFCFILLCSGTYLVDALLSSCPHTMFQHGKIRFSNRGTKMKFTCFKPYNLIGNAKLECENGEWNGPMPVCASKNCPALPELHHGKITYFNNRAVTKLQCNANFTLIGSSQMHCVGDGWNDTVTADCQANSIRQFGICHFEPNDTKQCEWISKSGFFNWTLMSSRPEDNTHMPKDSFPYRDHTIPSSFGHFLYLETLVAPTKLTLSVMNSEKATAKLISPLFPPLDEDEPHCLIFYIYARGPHAGVVEVLINEDSIWRSNGSLGMEWKKINIPLRNRSNQFRITIEGKGELGQFTGTAIDDLRITAGDECQETDHSGVKSSDVMVEGLSTKTSDEIDDPGTSTVQIQIDSEIDNKGPLVVPEKQFITTINSKKVAEEVNSFIKDENADSTTEIIITQNNIIFHNSAENRVNDSGITVTEQEIHTNISHDRESDNELQINIPTNNSSSNDSSIQQNILKENQDFYNDMSMLGHYISNSTEKTSNTPAENTTHLTTILNNTVVKPNDAKYEDDHQKENGEDEIDEKDNDHRHFENVKNDLKEHNNQNNNEIKNFSAHSSDGNSNGSKVLWVVLLGVTGVILLFIVIAQIYKKSYSGKRRKDESSIQFIKSDDIGSDLSRSKDDVLVINCVPQ